MSMRLAFELSHMPFARLRKFPCIYSFLRVLFLFQFLCICWHGHVFFPPLFHWYCESCWFIFRCHTNLTFWYKPFLVKIYYPFISCQTPFAKILWGFPIYVMTDECRCTLFPCGAFVWFCYCNTGLENKLGSNTTLFWKILRISIIFFLTYLLVNTASPWIFLAESYQL